MINNKGGYIFILLGITVSIWTESYINCDLLCLLLYTHFLFSLLHV